MDKEKKKRELTIEQTKKLLREILEGVRTGTIGLGRAKVAIDCAKAIVETWVLQHEYLEMKKENPDYRIDFMESTELDDLPSKQELSELKTLIALTRKNFKNRAKL